MKPSGHLFRKLRGALKRSFQEKSLNIHEQWVKRYTGIFDRGLLRQEFWKNHKLVFQYAQLYLYCKSCPLKTWYEEFRRQFNRRGRRIALSATLLAAFDWEKERIQFESVRKELNEFTLVERLKKRTYCLLCNKKILIGNMKLPGVEYCTCDRKKVEVLQLKEAENGGGGGDLDDINGWEPYIERNRMLTWRREIKPGLYAYKVYVVYPDVSADDFLFVQTSIEYRKQWDETAVQLEVIDADRETNSQIIYWEMLWPKLFSNRDYVYQRRTFIDEERNLIIIVNKSTSHPKHPTNPSKQRVDEYWSNMVIRPKTTMSKPGLEFVLTYFDDPGLSIPTSITTWVAQRQMPDFLDKLHQATLEYAKARKLREKQSRDIWRRDPGFEYPNLEQEEVDDKDDSDMDPLFMMTDPAASPEPEETPTNESSWSWWNIKKWFLFG